MKRVIALGFFDGLHRGHAALISRTVRLAREEGATPCVLTFDRPPAKNVLEINTNADKVEGIKRIFGIDDVITICFDEKTRMMPWRDFASMLVDEYGACHLVAGYDFRFGYMGEGNTAMLRKFCEERGVGFDKVEKVSLNGDTVSSTMIRALLADGKLRQANEYLGHAHYFSGIVQHGLRVGRTLGFPTVNLMLPEGVVAPKFGVYGTEVTTPEGVYRGITNVGVSPTVKDDGVVSIETNLFGFRGDLYGQRIRIDYLVYIRPERKFSSIEELKRQIARDSTFFNT
ncbi:MAG: riboflavin biosynthesis protein RibF [Oscillospiraceae bacterium]|nr:riboflavin biosynthesis protein RibF [Oscillospiraceae bacterium]